MEDPKYQVLVLNPVFDPAAPEGCVAVVLADKNGTRAKPVYLLKDHGRVEVNFDVDLGAVRQELQALKTQLVGARTEVSTLAQRLDGCRNEHKKKDEMIKARQRKLVKSHEYIEKLKAEKKELEELVVRLKQVVRLASSSEDSPTDLDYQRGQ